MNNKEIVSGLINKEGKIFEFEKLEECPVDESRCREIALQAIEEKIEELTPGSQSIDEDEVKRIIGETEPKAHTHTVEDISDLEAVLSEITSPITLDDSPTEDSENAVKSGGIYEALSGKADSNHTHGSIILKNGAAILGTVSLENDRITGVQLVIGLSQGLAGLPQTLSITAPQLLKLENAIDPDTTRPVENSQKLITSGAVYAAIAEAIDEPAELYLCKDNGGALYLWGSGEDTDLDNINSVKSFLVNNPANITKRCLITHTERAGSSESQDTVTYYTGYARWTKPHSNVYYVELWVPGLYKFLTCSASSPEEDPSDIDADSWDNAWTQQSLS